VRRGDYAVEAVGEEHVVVVVDEGEVCVGSGGRRSILTSLLATSSLDVT